MLADFPVTCRDTDMISDFIRMRRVLKSAQIHKIYNRIEWAFLMEHIYDTHRKLGGNDRAFLSIHTEFKS